MNRNDTLKIVIVGHVDHGKSTLIGRLFHDTGSIPETRLREIEETCRRQGRPFEFAYLMDALQEERDQNVTIDTAQTFFKTAKRSYVIIDAPGHVEFLKNMITGAASADAAILLVDGVEGVQEQTRRHAYLLSLLGIRQVLVAVNKLDRAGYDRSVFTRAENDIRSFLHALGIVPAEVVPVSAQEGENLVHRLGHTPWYAGPTLLEALDALRPVAAEIGLPLRFPVQDVYKWDGLRRYVGRVESGTVCPGDDVTFLPSGRRTRVRTVEKWQQPDLPQAGAGESIGLTFSDEIFVERGEILAHSSTVPATAREIRASVFWLGTQPFERGATCRLKLATAEVEATCAEIEERIDSSTLEVVERHAAQLNSTESGTVVFTLKQPLAADLYTENSRTGRFVIQTGEFIGGGGIVRGLQAAARVGAAQVIHLDRHLTTEPDGNLVDLTRAQGTVEFELSPRFVDGMARGERILFRLRGPQQIEHVARLAYEQHLGFRFSRDADQVSLVLYQDGPRPPPLPLTPGLGL